MSNNYVAELTGIQLGLKYLDSCEEVGSALFLVDCVPAICASFDMKVNKEYASIASENKILAKRLMEKGWLISATWMPAHQGFVPNELADKLAKECAASAKEIIYPCDKKVLINQLKEIVLDLTAPPYTSLKGRQMRPDVINMIYRNPQMAW